MSSGKLSLQMLRPPVFPFKKATAAVGGGERNRRQI